MGNVEKQVAEEVDRGDLEAGQDLGNVESYSVALGDLDGDGDLDAFFGRHLTFNRVYLNDGSGTLIDTGQWVTGGLWGNSHSIDLGDVDGDGDLDAFLSSFTANRVYLNDGTGYFVDSGQQLGNSMSFGVVLGDLDGDDDLDAFVANGNTDSNRIYLNEGTGLFVDSGVQVGGTNMSHAAVLGDLDGDGKSDAVLGAHGDGLIGYYEVPGLLLVTAALNIAIDAISRRFRPREVPLDDPCSR